MLHAVMWMRLFCQDQDQDSRSQDKDQDQDSEVQDQDQGKTLLGRPLNRLYHTFLQWSQNETNSIHTKWHDTQMKRRRLFILSTGAQQWHTQDFWIRVGSEPRRLGFFVFFVVVNIPFYAFWHTSFINHIVYHGRWTNANSKVTDTSMEIPDVRLLLAEATRNAIYTV